MSCSCTAYTSLILDGEVTTAAEFIKACFHATAVMRKLGRDSLKSEIPTELPKPHFYYEERLDEAKKELEKCRSYTLKDWQDIIDKHLAEDIEEYEKVKRENDEFAAKLNAIREGVEKWDCDPAYAGVKAFALEQIQSSMPQDPSFYRKCIENWQNLTAEEYKKEHIEDLEQSIKFYEDHLQEEKKDYEDRLKLLTGFPAELAKLEGK